MINNFVNLRYKLHITPNTKVNSVVFVAKPQSFSLWEYIIRHFVALIIVHEFFPF